MSIRRVVTGVNPEGTSVFVSDEAVKPVTPALLPGLEFHRLWGQDEAPASPQDGTPPPSHDYFPPAGGYRVGTFTVPPESAPPEGVDLEAGFAEIFEYVVSGRVVLELDDGATVELGPGDTVVQNGTRHAWRNPFDEPATLVVVLIGATRA